jgi:hypothetical protein
MEDEEPISQSPIPQRRTRDATSEAVLNFFNTPVGMAALNGVSEEATATAKYAIFALQGILATWVTKRILLDVLDMVMKINETRNALIKKT